MKHSKILLHFSPFYIILSLCVTLSVFLIGNIQTRKGKIPSCKQCNIVLIVLDPLRADALPCYGYSKNTAPNLCAFAQKNLLYSHMYSHASWTLPSIMSLFSSQYPSHHAVFEPIVDVLSPQTVTLPMALKSAGYHTVFIGPTDSDHVPLTRGIGRGFDTVIPYTSIRDATNTLKNVQRNTKDTPIFVFIHSFDLRANSTNTNKSPKTFVLDPEYTYGSIDPSLVHSTLKTIDSKATITYLRKWYDQIIVEIDQQLGELFESIASSPSSQNTIIAITSDHGTEFGEHGESGHGANLFATTTHVPFILSIPKVSSRKIDALAQSIDIYPSLLGLTGVPIPKTAEGINLFTTNLFSKTTYNTVSISQLEPQKNLSSVRSLHWSYYFDPKRQHEGTLYNLLIDPTETNPITTGEPTIVNQFIEAYTNALSK